MIPSSCVILFDSYFVCSAHYLFAADFLSNNDFKESVQEHLECTLHQECIVNRSGDLSTYVSIWENIMFKIRTNPRPCLKRC